MKYILAILFFLSALGASAQSQDTVTSKAHASLQKKDSVTHKTGKVQNTPSAGKAIPDSTVANTDSTTKIAVALPPTPKELLEKALANDAIHHTYAGKNIVKLLFPKQLLQNKKQNTSNIRLHVFNNHGDLLFYVFLGLLTLLGIVRTWFPKYSRQITHFLIQPNLRRKQSKESAHIQNIVPSLLFNILFVLSSALCIGQMVEKNITGISFWIICLYSAVAITAIYLIKYVVIKLSGWLFNAQAAASTYNYVVFSINKIIGILLIPATIIVAYCGSNAASTTYYIAGILVGCLFLYRYIASFLLIRGSLNVSVFHFFLYLCAVEIIPLLITYKVLLINHSGYIYN